jgi:NAD(P)H-hydrate epimerase
MQRAGEALARNISGLVKSGRILMYIGTGNNGGDGLVAAKLLAENGSDVGIILIKGPDRIRSDLSRAAFQRLPSGIDVMTFDEAGSKGSLEDETDQADVIVDGLLGSGAMGEPKGIYREAVEWINKGRKIVSIDIPTGIGSRVSVNSDLTVTFHDVKSTMIDEEGNPLPECGKLVVEDIGIPRDAAVFIGKGDLLRIPMKSPDSHKGRGGKVLIIGGGPYTGAPILASLGAMSTGCDLVRAAVPSGIWQVVASSSPCMITERLETEDPFSLDPGVFHQLIPSIDWADSVLIGPGSGRKEETLKALRELADHAVNSGKKVVIDADGISSVSRRTGIWPDIDSDRVLLTPHMNELMTLLDGAGIGFDTDKMEKPFNDPDRKGAWSPESLDPVVRFSRITGTTILVKGRVDMIMSPHDQSLNRHILYHPVFVRYNRTGVPEMSIGGTGDVLAGLCSGFMSKGMNAFDSACVSSYINGRAGERSFNRLKISMKATDILEDIPQVLDHPSSGS